MFRCTEKYAGVRCGEQYVAPKPTKSSSVGRAFVTILIITLIAGTVAIVIFVYRKGGFDYIRDKFDNLSYRLRSSYESTSTGRSNIPYVQTHNKPEDSSYTDPFS